MPLKLDSRSLVYSVVEVRTDFDIGAFCCRASVTGTRWKTASSIELMEDAEDTEVNTSITFLFGRNRGKRKADEAELEIIEQYADELDEKYDRPSPKRFFQLLL